MIIQGRSYKEGWIGNIKRLSMSRICAFELLMGSESRPPVYANYRDHLASATSIRSEQDPNKKTRNFETVGLANTQNSKNFKFAMLSTDFSLLRSNMESAHNVFSAL